MYVFKQVSKQIDFNGFLDDRYIKTIVKYLRKEKRHRLFYDNYFFNCSTNTTQDDKISIACYSCSFENRNVNATHFCKTCKDPKP